MSPVSIQRVGDEARPLLCEAPHPAWNRAEKYRGRPHLAMLPVRPPAGLRFELVRLLPADAELQDVRPDLWGVQCGHKDCRRIHEYRIS